MTALAWLAVLIIAPLTAWGALDLCLPTAHDGFLRGDDAGYFQPTVEGTTLSGTFGCVRRGGARFHEGIDIACRQRDRAGECIERVHAVAAGTVAFVNHRPGLSNYGRYVVLTHQWDGVEVCTLYAHLRDIAPGLIAGQPVTKGQVIGIMGRSTNTREGIPPERAHLHFEVNFLLNPFFRVWYPRRDPQAPPFGNFNGKNLVGLDPAALFRAYAANRRLNFAEYLAAQPVAFSVLVPGRPFPWLERHPQPLVARAVTPVAYEIAATGWGLPVRVIPRQERDLTEPQLRSLRRGLPVVREVNAAELARAGCRNLIAASGRGWQLTNVGREWIELLTFVP